MLGLALVGAGRLAAQADTALARAFDLERRGAFGPAAEAYRSVLLRDAADLQALFGLERTLTPLNRVEEMAPLLGPVLAAKPSPAAFAVALRVWLAAGQGDSARRVVERWVKMDTDKRAPYREWGDLLLARRNPGAAKRAYALGRAASGDSTAFAMELAQAATASGDLAGAASDWAEATAQFPGLRVTAVQALSRAPEAERPGILHSLDEAGPEGKWLAALLAGAWGDPADAVRRLEAALPEGPRAIEVLRDLAAQLRGASVPAARQALGRALELLAARSSGGAVPSLRLEAARAYADGGDRAGARRMLAALAADPGASAALGPDARRLVIATLIDDGDLDEAERVLAQPPAGLSPEDAVTLRRALALGWARAGRLDRAQHLVPADSSVETAALQGLLFLYKGDLGNARRAFRWAGPYAGTRAESTERTRLLALLQPMEADTLPLLGAGLWALARGDTAGAVTALAPLVDSLPMAKGGAEVTLLLGEIAAARGDSIEAERRFRAVVAANVLATSPAAEYALARYLTDRGRPVEAIGALEHLILTWSNAAVVPEARRLLEQLRRPVAAA
jgi:tetratricopeptide (TPR) repeat protein